MTLYELLDVEHNADFKALKKSYFARTKEVDSDRHAGSRLKEEQFNQFVAAFKLLSEPLCRAKYDCSLLMEHAARSSHVTAKQWSLT